MKIVIAPDSYKESLSAKNVAVCIEAGFKEIFPLAEYTQLPIADGGEGTVETMISASQGHKIYTTVTGPLGEPVNAFYGLSANGRHAFIEMAAASGLALIPARQRNPLLTTSYGTGELILHALDQKVEHITIGIGGSATNDGGAGMAQALGVSLLDKNDMELPYGGAALANLNKIDLSAIDRRLANTCIDVACDVTNPLTGNMGTSSIFGPQKGATPEMVALLDKALKHYATLLIRDVGITAETLPGAGAGGGIGIALYAFCSARLRSGIELMIELIGLDKAIQNADLIITGEGKLDSQTAHGKVPAGVAQVAKRYGKPVIAIAGSLDQNAHILHQYGIDAMFSVMPKICSLDEALEQAAENIRHSAYNIAAVIRLANSLK